MCLKLLPSMTLNFFSILLLLFFSKKIEKYSKCSHCYLKSIVLHAICKIFLISVVPRIFFKLRVPLTKIDLKPLPKRIAMYWCPIVKCTFQVYQQCIAFASFWKSCFFNVFDWKEQKIESNLELEYIQIEPLRTWNTEIICI